MQLLPWFARMRYCVSRWLCDIHDEYNLAVDKTTCCVTDNGHNSVKPFKEPEIKVEPVDAADATSGR